MDSCLLGTLDLGGLLSLGGGLGTFTLGYLGGGSLYPLALGNVGRCYCRKRGFVRLYGSVSSRLLLGERRGTKLGEHLRLRRRPDRRMRLDVEQPAVDDTHEQDGRSPLDVVLVGVDRLARLSHRRVDRETVGEGGIELGAEHDRSPIRDLELHPDDRGDLAFDQARRDAREWVLDRAPTAFARVEDGQPEGHLVCQDRAELDAADSSSATLLVLEQQDPIVGVVVVPAMADVVEDVVIRLAEADAGARAGWPLRASRWRSRPSR